MKKLVASDLGFAVAPRLNAAGRLDDMSLGIECLLAKDLVVARQMAHELDLLNKERREIETQMKQQAHDALNKLHFDNKKLPIGLSLFDPDWHQGVVGIVAGRIKDKFHRPVVAFAKINDTELKGSARSVAGLHIRDIFDVIATQNPGLIKKFGGHAMAAGLSIARDDFEKFAAEFTKVVAEHLSEDQLYGKIYSDGELTAEDLNLEFAELLRASGPWGQGFPEPIFNGKFRLMDQRIVGRKHLKLTLALEDSQQMIDAIAFNVTEGEWPNHRCEHLQAAYRLDINEYAGSKKLQLIIEYLEVC